VLLLQSSCSGIITIIVALWYYLGDFIVVRVTWVIRIVMVIRVVSC
jgi:hypothetical protein